MLLTPKYIEYTKLTEGEAIALLKAEKQRLNAQQARMKGDSMSADIYDQAAQLFESSVINKTVHTSNNVLASFASQPTFANSINQELSSLRFRTKAAMNLRNVPADFVPVELTQAEIQVCIDEAERLADEKYPGVGQGDREERLKEDLLFRTEKKCLLAKENEKIINEKVRAAGPVGLYARFQNQVVYKNLITNKRNSQLIWIKDTAKGTAVSEEIIALNVDNAILNQIGKSATEIETELGLYIRKSGSGSNGINHLAQQNSRLSFPFAIVIPIITAIAGAIQATALLIKALKEQRQKNLFSSIQDPSIWAPAEPDFNGNCIADSQETFFDKIILPKNLLLLGGVFTAIDPFKWFKGASTKYIIGGGLAATGLVIGSTTEKKWIVGGNCYNAAEMKALGYVQNNGEWYAASSISDRTNIDIGTIINAGKSAYDAWKDAFDAIKDANTGGPVFETPEGLPEFIGLSSEQA